LAGLINLLLITLFDQLYLAEVLVAVVIHHCNFYSLLDVWDVEPTNAENTATEC
jgi:hypothetical protein